METFWVKHYSNGSTLAEWQFPSWSRSGLKEVVGVELVVMWNPCEQARFQLMKGPGEYHQSDDWEVSSEGGHVCLARRIQFKQEDGRWLTKEYDMVTGEDREYISDDRI
jgi:hypothetical protein